MNIPKSVGWKTITEGVTRLEVVDINHISFGFPPETTEKDKQEIESFFYSMGTLFDNTSNVEKNKPNEWFIYPKGNTPGYEHLLMPSGTVDKPFYHIEIDVKSTDEEIKEVFPDAWEEQPNMFWLTVSENFLGILWAVIITNKRNG